MSLAIKLKGIEKNYPGVVANHDVDITIEKGNIHAIIGENGAGKSTLMKILYGMVKPDAGTISIFESPATIKSPQDAIGLGIGMVHQHFMLADNATVLENIVLGSEPMKAKVVVDYAKARADLQNIIQTYGLDINPDDLVADLGVGFRQRVEIAKVLFRGAKIIILDEPLSALDVTVQRQILGLLNDLKARHRLAYLFITHDLGVARALSDRVAVMHRGRVVETGPTETIFNAPTAPYTQHLLAAVPVLGAGRRHAGGAP